MDSDEEVELTREESIDWMDSDEESIERLDFDEEVKLNTELDRMRLLREDLVDDIVDKFRYDLVYDTDETGEMVWKRNQAFVVLSLEAIAARQARAVEYVSGAFEITSEQAWALLNHYQWNVTRLTDEWFENGGVNQHNVCMTVGILLNGHSEPCSGKCTICLDDYSSDEMTSVGCGHFYCHECWAGYIRTAVDGGSGCLSLRCPYPACRVLVLQEMVKKFSEDEHFQKYKRFLLRAYVEGSNHIKWCPAPDCACAVEHFGDENYDVSCTCKFSFCWKCTEEAHRPVDCRTFSNWMAEGGIDKNKIWLQANSKPCPKCNVSIEKNQGCMHMSCSHPCNFQFCWLCLGDWSTHGANTGGFDRCTIYEEAKKEGVYDEIEESKEKAKRYGHYYGRWASHAISLQKAQADLLKAENDQFANLADSFGKMSAEIIIEAWSQIVECRRMLKWTYAYGYYLNVGMPKTELFEFNQGEAEYWLECLHSFAEKKLQSFLNPETTKTREEFVKLCIELAALTGDTRKYFENFVKVLEDWAKDAQQQQQQPEPLPEQQPQEPSPEQQQRTPEHYGNGWRCSLCQSSNPLGVDFCYNCDRRRAAPAH